MLVWPFFLYRRVGNRNYKIRGNTIIIANHYSNFDPFFIQLLFINRTIHFVTISDAKRKLHSRFLSWLFDAVYLDDHWINYQFIKDSIKSLKEDHIMCIFPEGVINPRKYGFFDFKKTYLLLAEKAGSAILPLYIFPELRFFRKSSIYIGDPILLKDHEFRTLDEANALIQSRIIDYSFEISQ